MYKRQTHHRQGRVFGARLAAGDRRVDEAGAALEAYSDGVNAWLRTVQAKALGRGAPEFFLFSPDIAPWTPADSLAIQKLLALQLTDKAGIETLRARLSLVLPPERVRDILPDSPNAPVMGLPQFSELFPGLDAAAPTKLAARDPLDPVPEPGTAGASNAFAATGARTAGGAPLLASDPHLGLTAPSIWMLARSAPGAGRWRGAAPRRSSACPWPRRRWKRRRFPARAPGRAGCAPPPRRSRRASAS